MKKILLWGNVPGPILGPESGPQNGAGFRPKLFALIASENQPRATPTTSGAHPKILTAPEPWSARYAKFVKSYVGLNSDRSSQLA